MLMRRYGRLPVLFWTQVKIPFFNSHTSVSQPTGMFYPAPRPDISYRSDGCSDPSDICWYGCRFF